MKTYKSYRVLISAILFIQSWQVFAVVVTPTKNSSSIRIIENKGQWEPQVLFKAAIPSGNIFITKQGISYALFDENALHKRDHDRIKVDTINRHNLKVEFVNSNSNATIIKEQKSTEYYNYFIGSDESKWANHCYAYKKVTYQNIYPNTDLEFIAQENSFKLNFIVHAGGDPPA